MYLRNLGKEQTTKTCRKREVLKIRAEIVQVENWWLVKKLNEFKIWFFEKTSKIDHLFLTIVEKKRNLYIAKMYLIRNKKGERTTNRKWIKRLGNTAWTPATINLKAQRKCIRCKFKSCLMIYKPRWRSPPSLFRPLATPGLSGQKTKSSDLRPLKSSQNRQTGREVGPWRTTGTVARFPFFPCLPCWNMSAVPVASVAAG